MEHDEAQPEGSDPLVVQVVGHTFYWEYTYPNGVVTSGYDCDFRSTRPVRLELDAADVIHSWWVPELTGKRDAIPGRPQHTRLHGLEDRRLRGSVCRALRRAARDHADHRRGRPRGRVRRLARGAGGSTGRRHVRARPADLGRGLREMPRARRQRAATGPRSPATRCSSTSRRSGTSLPRAATRPTSDGYMPPISTGWPDGQLQALIDYLAATPGLAPPGQEQGS